MSTVTIADPEIYTKALGIEWSMSADCFSLTTSDLSPIDAITKRSLVSDIAKTFDVLGWFAPAIIKAKMLFQQILEPKVDWDEKYPHLYSNFGCHGGMNFTYCLKYACIVVHINISGILS